MRAKRRRSRRYERRRQRTNVIILACGKDNYGWTAETPKHLALIDGVPLLARTIRQINARGYRNILVATHNELVKKMGVSWFTPKPRRWPVETFLSTRPRWGSDRTIVIAGDTAFSDAVMRTVIADWGPIGVHGNRNEIFAVTFRASQYDKVAAALKKAVEYAARRGPLYGNFWHFYRALSGFHLHAHRFEKVYLRMIDQSKDPTTDFDNPGRYKAWLKKTGHHG